MKQFKHQNGAVLLVSLIMLVIMTLLAVTAINTSTINLRIVDNMQSQQRAEMAANDAIEQVLSNINFFYNSTSTPTFTVDGLTVNVTARDCLQTYVAPGESEKNPNPAFHTLWELASSVTDTDTGAQTEIHHGIVIRLPNGNCT